MISLLAVALLSAPTYDLVIRGGSVIDGTGKPAFRADVGVRNGRIAAVGAIAGKGKAELSAKGLVVAPGFIDVHTHGENIEAIPGADNFIRMGVTTIVIGNCGSSKTGIGSFFRKLSASTRPAVNVASLIGHNSVRASVMGSRDRQPTKTELEKMRALVGKAMREGALGLSTGLIYTPGTFSKTDELVSLAKVAAKYDGMYVSHMRSEGPKIFEALAEVFRIGREAKLPVHISHIKVSGNAMWGKSDLVLDAIAAAERDGLKVTQDQYLYTASSTGMSQLIPDFAVEGGRASFRQRLRNPETKERIFKEMREMLAKNGRSDYTYAAIASYSRDRSLNGLRVPQAARKKYGSDSLASQMRLVLEIHSNGGATGVFHGIAEDDLREFLRHPDTMIASDSSVRRTGAGVPHPRGYGNNARALGRYVRGEKLISLEEMVRKMTSLPATTFKLDGRGVIRTGAWADLTVFHPVKVADPATFERPQQFAKGFTHVLVNGVPVVKNGSATSARPGKPLKRGN